MGSMASLREADARRRRVAELRSSTREHYEQAPFIEGGSARVDRWRRKLRREVPELDGAGTILDIGCGSAEVAAALAQIGAEVVCIDLTSAATAAAARRGLPASQADALQLPFASGAFPVSLAMGVLHHTPDCRAALAEAARVTSRTMVVLVYSRYTPYHLAYLLSGRWRRRSGPERRPIHSRWAMAGWRWVLRVLIGLQLDDAQVQRMVADQFLTPQASFHTRREIARWAADVGFQDRRVVTYPGYSRLHVLVRTP